MTTLTPPDLSRGAGEIALVEDAVVVPPSTRPVLKAPRPSGVLKPDGSFVAEGVTWSHHAMLTLPPAPPHEEAVEDLAGTWLFLGPLFDHFGHLMVDSLARIWALDAVGDRIDGVIFVPHFLERSEGVAEAQFARLELLGVAKPKRLVVAPTRVERLFVPPPGLGVRRMSAGTPELRAFVHAHAGRGVEPQGSEQLYISRSGLSGPEGGLLGEAVLEERLRAEGYAIYHPQAHSFRDQIAAYRAARDVIAVEGSALHLLALVGTDLRRVAVLSRRGNSYDHAFARQIRAFQGAEVRVIDCLDRNWLVPPDQAPGWRSWGEPHLPTLRRRLSQAGLIDGRAPWGALTQRDVEAELVRLGEARSVALTSFEGPEGTGQRAARLAKEAAARKQEARRRAVAARRAEKAPDTVAARKPSLARRIARRLGLAGLLRRVAERPRGAREAGQAAQK